MCLSNIINSAIHFTECASLRVFRLNTSNSVFTCRERIRDLIIYFSATGNSKYAATKVSLGTTDSMVSLAKSNHQGNFSFHLDSGENLGIVCPTYFGGLPSLVDEYLRKLEITSDDDDPYIFCLLTHSGKVGSAPAAISEILSSKKLKLDAMFSVRMPNSFTPLNNACDKAAIDAINAEADKKIAEITDMVSAKKKGDFSGGARLGLKSKLAHKKYEAARMTSHLSSDPQVCIGCGRCMKLCPVGAIDAKEKDVRWTKESCVMCLGCLNRCPVNAISYDDSTRGKGQYVHPGVKLSMGV